MSCEFIITKSRTMYPKNTVEDGDFQIVTAFVEEVIKGNLKKNSKYNTITLKGNMPVMLPNKKYHFIGQEVYDEKYKSYNYNVSYLGERIINIQNKEDLKILLESVTSKKNTKEILKLEDLTEVLTNNDKKRLTSIKGIGDKIANKIFEKYNKQLQLGVENLKLAKLGIPLKTIQELSDSFGNYKIAYNKVMENPYILCKYKGIGFIKADKIAMEVGIAPNSTDRIREFVIYYLNEEANNGKSYINTTTLINNIAELQKDEYVITKKMISNLFYQMREDGVLWWNDKKTIIALESIRNIEQDLYKEIIRLSSVNAEIIENWETTVNEIEEQQGWQYTEEQKEGIKATMSNNFVVITGLAGTGKSSVLKPLTYTLKQNGATIEQVALSGKAAKRIEEVTKMEAKTIHRLLEVDVRTGMFIYNKRNKLEDIDAIIVDESSMINAKLFLDLLQSIPTGTRVLLLGDVGQLACIGIGCVLNDLIETNIVKCVRLTKIHRQAQKSGIITTSLDVRNKKQIIDAKYSNIERLGEMKDLLLDITLDKEEIQDKVINYFLEEYNKFKNIMEVQIGVATRFRGNISAYVFNTKIQKLVNKDVFQEPFLAECPVAEGIKYLVGINDKVIITKNNRKVEILNPKTEKYETGTVYNGNMGIVKNVTLEHMIIDIEGVGRTKIKKEEFNTIELAYACTIHKTQGSEFKSFLIPIDMSAYTMLSCEWLYTAITRAKESCVIVGENNAFRMCCKNSQNIEKNTFLKNFLLNS